MAAHKRQHLMPVCLLSNFGVDGIPPKSAGREKRKPVNLFVMDKSKEDGVFRLRSTEHKTFWKSWYYSIKASNSLFVEKTLGNIEGRFSTAVRKIFDGEELAGKDFVAISDFAASMLLRTELSFEYAFHQKALFERITNLLPGNDEVCRGILDYMDDSRKIDIVTEESLSKVKANTLSIIEITGDYGLVASDNPVGKIDHNSNFVKQFLPITYMNNHGISDEIYALPVSPKHLLLISSAKVSSAPQVNKYYLNDMNCISYFNHLQVSNMDSQIISSTQCPFGDAAKSQIRSFYDESLSNTHGFELFSDDGLIDIQNARVIRQGRGYMISYNSKIDYVDVLTRNIYRLNHHKGSEIIRTIENPKLIKVDSNKNCVYIGL